MPDPATPAVLDRDLPTAAVSEPRPTGKPELGAVVIVGDHPLPKDGRFTIVVEGRVYGDGASKPKTDGYPAGADLYYRTDPAVRFPPKSNVVTLGVDVRQGHFWGFTLNREYLNVGPAHPAFGGANLAYQHRAKAIEIIGLNDAEKALIQPYIDALPTDVIAPATVPVTLA